MDYRKKTWNSVWCFVRFTRWQCSETKQHKTTEPCEKKKMKDEGRFNVFQVGCKLTQTWTTKLVTFVFVPHANRQLILCIISQTRYNDDSRVWYSSQQRKNNTTWKIKADILICLSNFLKQLCCLFERDFVAYGYYPKVQIKMCRFEMRLVTLWCVCGRDIFYHIVILHPGKSLGTKSSLGIPRGCWKEFYLRWTGTQSTRCSSTPIQVSLE